MRKLSSQLPISSLRDLSGELANILTVKWRSKVNPTQIRDANALSHNEADSPCLTQTWNGIAEAVVGHSPTSSEPSCLLFLSPLLPGWRWEYTECWWGWCGGLGSDSPDLNFNPSILSPLGAALSFQQESWSLSDGFSTMAPSRSFQFPQKCFQGLQYGDVHRADKNGARNRTRVAFPAGMVLV